VDYFCKLGWDVHGVDNNMRADFFGPDGDTRWNQRRLQSLHARFHHNELDIRDRRGVDALIDSIRPSLIVHAAAQPSHDLAASRPFDDFDVNATGTLNLLEATRRHVPRTAFVHMSSNKVYGDRPNTIRLKELPTRWEYDDPRFVDGIDETYPIDQSTHGLFGSSKVAADVMAQEYGRSFEMNTCCLRGGCLTGPNHSGVELHGFLSYLVRCNVEGRQYRVYGYKGKQVRDNIHSVDVARFIHAFCENPRCGEVYNIGGGRTNSTSILEAFDHISRLSGKPMRWEYAEKNRDGDHICYVSDLSKMKAHYPGWDISKSLEQIFVELFEAARSRGTPATMVGKTAGA
jgi:CDP-paratose 2-epimerase